MLELLLLLHFFKHDKNILLHEEAGATYTTINKSGFSFTVFSLGALY